MTEVQLPLLDWRPNPAHWATSNLHRFTATPMCSSLSARPRIMRRKAVWLDQGQEGACTGFGEEHVQALSPYPQPTSDTLAREVYYLARRHDEWEGEDYEGSSVNGAMRAARELGRVKAWKWARTVEEAAHGLSYHGAGEAGTWWHQGMVYPDVDGHVHPTGPEVGGHAYALAGFEWAHNPRVGRMMRRYWIDNSWGSSWGRDGGAWIWEDELGTLLGRQGELAFPTKAR